MKDVRILLLVALASWNSVHADLEWWQTTSVYQIYPRSWKDSDGDGIGDLPGIESKLQHLVDSGIDTFWLSPIYESPMVDFGYDISNFTSIDPIFGTMDDFDNLVATAKSLGLKVIMDLVPNHSSDEHEWFVKSLAGTEPYSDYYIWHNGTVLENGTITVPNNWISFFGGSAWTWSSARQAYYLHQYTEEQPDLNYRNEYVVQEMKDIIEFWLDRGIDGFRVDTIMTLVEDASFPDEPLSGTTDDSTDHDYLLHYYTEDQIETYEVVAEWRELLDDYAFKTDNVTRIMMMEAYSNLTMTLLYYDYGAHFPFNFRFIRSVDSSSTAQEVKELAIDAWLDNLPDNATADWVLGNHDNSRVASRYTPEQVDALNMINLLLPGVSVTYYGEEIGMEDESISWEDTVDPQACNQDEDSYESNSRDPARTPMQWDTTTSAGFSTNESTWLPVNSNYLTLNLAAQIDADVSHYKVFQDLTTLRKETVIQEGTVNVQLLSDNVICFSRELESSSEDAVFVLTNFANNTETVSLDVFENAPDSLVVYIASVNSTLTAGTAVSRSSVEVSAYAGLVLRTSTESSANVLISTATLTLCMAFLVSLQF
ncbi:alpha-glucosidase-like [Neodiprion virginianus]|uniref:alpha-glucosidase-like n=1 Tax=Neodiprion virginianus TaxID=2961670 RepID=UPI001EE7261A|nr:alpha-glucosidase-like [Neodiprion virginianus]XP_046609143.1 alpha-glucosidase-like [Neodiprion virginianus]